MAGDQSAEDAEELRLLVEEFLTESAEGLERYDAGLLALERDPADQDALAGTFRAVHTIKGTCRFLGYVSLEALAHAAETLLGFLRDGVLTMNQQIASVLLETGDGLRAMLAEIESTGAAPAEAPAELIQRLESSID